MVRNILTVIFVIVCIVLTIIVLLQEGKAGLGTIAGSSSATSETYWGKNKSRSKEGKLALITKVLAIVFLLLAILLNMNVI